MTVADLNDKYSTELRNLGEMVNGGNTYVKVEVEESAFEAIEYYALLKDFNEFNEEFVEEEEVLEIQANDPFAEPPTPSKISITLQTIESRIVKSDMDVTRADVNTYIRTGNLTHVESGQPIRDYESLAAASRNNNGNRVTVLYVANKTGN